MFHVSFSCFIINEGCTTRKLVLLLCIIYVVVQFGFWFNLDFPLFDIEVRMAGSQTKICMHKFACTNVTHKKRKTGAKT